MPLRTSRNSASPSKLALGLDAAAILIALVLAALVRFNVIRHLAW